MSLPPRPSGTGSLRSALRFSPPGPLVVSVAALSNPKPHPVFPKFPGKLRALLGGTTGAVWWGARRPTARAGVRRSTRSSRPDRRRPLERLRKIVFFFFFLGSSLSSSAGKMGRDGDPGTFGDASRAVKHMNDDHIDSLVAWAHYYLNVPAHITDVALVDCTEEGFHLMVEGVW